MEALGELSPFAYAEAEIKDKIGDFLASEKKLLPLVDHPSLEISTEAAGLLTAQKQLEKELGTVLSDLQQKLDLSKATKAGIFAKDLITHISRVNRIVGKSQQGFSIPPSSPLVGGESRVGQYMILGAGVLLMAYIFTR